MEKIIEKYFKDEKIMYFHQSDWHKNLEGDTYLRYKYSSQPGYIELYFGGDNGEVCVLVTNDPEKLASLIKIILYA